MVSRTRDVPVTVEPPQEERARAPGGRRLPLSHWGFGTGPAGLEIAGLAVAELARRFGTPLYVFDEARLARNAERALADARAALPRADLFYSLKTNPVPRALEILRRHGLGAEVISAEELRTALGVGFAPRRIVFNGPGKRDEELALAVDCDALVQVESLSEARALARIAAIRGRVARAGIRINPDVCDPGADRTLRLGERGSVFGLDPDAPEFGLALECLRSAPSVRLESLSLSIGTGITQAEPFRRAARALSRVWRRLAASGVALGTLDLGGGFAVPSEVRYPEGAADPLAAGRAAPVPAPEEIAGFGEVCRAMAEELPAAPVERVVLEPGRLLVADAFHLLARVVRVKDGPEHPFLVLDASRAQNALFAARGYHEIVAVRDPDAAPRARYTLAGPLCASFDTYARGRALPPLEEGDLLLLLDVGAYNLSAQSHWTFAPAPVVALGRGEPRIVPVRG